MSEEIAPTTDCPTCNRTAKECNDSRAKGWGNCCMACDERGSVAGHRLQPVVVTKWSDDE